MTTAKMTNRLSDDRSEFLRRAVMWDAGIVTLLGVGLLMAASPVARFLGVANPQILHIIGVAALLYDGGRLVWSTMGEEIDSRLVYISLYGNAIWALLSIPLLTAGLLPLTDGGWWVMAAMADFAALFAVVQWYGLRQSKR